MVRTIQRTAALAGITEAVAIATVEATRSLDVMRLAGAGYLSGPQSRGWHWKYRDGTSARIDIECGRDEITINYRVRSHGEDWQLVRQPVPIHWTPCRFGGERPWFVCNVITDGVYCGREVAKLVSGVAAGRCSARAV
jgi:hypothetical protein